MLYDDTRITYDQATANYEGSWSLSVAEDSTLTETIVKFIQHLFSETSTVTETIAKKVQTLISEATGFTEALLYKIAISIAEISGITEEITKFIAKSFAETASLTETITNKVSKIFCEIPTFTEAKLFRIAIAISETASMVDIALRKIGKTFSDTSTVTEFYVKRVMLTFLEVPSMVEAMTFNIFDRLKNAIGIIKEFARISKKEEVVSMITTDVWEKEVLNETPITFDQADIAYDSTTAFYNDFIASEKPVLKLTTKQEFVSVDKKEDKPRILGD